MNTTHTRVLIPNYNMLYFWFFLHLHLWFYVIHFCLIFFSPSSPKNHSYLVPPQINEKLCVCFFNDIWNLIFLGYLLIFSRNNWVLFLDINIKIHSNIHSDSFWDPVLLWLSSRVNYPALCKADHVFLKSSNVSYSSGFYHY
jgi:hypothetical protein